ncbi:probable ATP-dependent RNA helicase DHX58 [Archocentrus centrarchus]|uniref:probable ATP-dependent RNA helicase DHX58 n=1 Tax=Archocentrus centrarchus TaxID=63155 RepID=UPI0011E9B955|nr:probable ATP-dependent RNA helicase DHX58 [Archocentrus centrarchus]XP_030592586.1 probable ATP-dependent RNA helicase DHX58 [Archocentrus centrarchus]
MADFELYTYQQEVVERALKRENIIIWLPTGGGKTRAAVYVAKRHLETTPKAKVMVLVNKVHLVDQHYNKEFEPHLSRDYDIRKVSGVSDEKDFFGLVVQDSDVVICTAQILYNALINKEEARHVELSDITLLIIDECHHTHKEGVYNKIMRLYVEKKLREEQPLPQILGLTASPGTGGAKTLDKAVEHVLQICANLDSAIVSTKKYAPELKERVPRPKKIFRIVEERPKDPFGDHLKGMMNAIHDYMALPPDFRLQECGTQEYETDVVMLVQRGIKEGNRVLAQCALHLRQYNDALLINDTLRMIDAYGSLEDFYIPPKNRAIDGTDSFLLELFEKNQVELKNLAMDPQFENPKMAELQSTLLEQFGSGVPSKGIIFSKTRKSTHCLKDWVLKNRELQEAGIKADILTGVGNGINYMTQNEQAETIQNFRRGALNLLISTSVAEEGLDIPECNLVVRYGLLTNEIAQQQATGRARAKDSRYSVVAQAGGREVHRERMNECLEDLTGKAIACVQTMTHEDFCTKISELQQTALTCSKIEQSRQAEKRSRNTAASVQLLCRSCLTRVASGSDIKLIDKMQYVNVNSDFKNHYEVGEQKTLDRRFMDWEPGCEINCKKCNKKWGHEIKYKKSALMPNLAIKNFALETPDGRTTVKKWKDAPFTVEDFNFEEYCEENFPDFLD